MTTKTNFRGKMSIIDLLFAKLMEVPNQNQSKSSQHWPSIIQKVPAKRHILQVYPESAMSFLFPLLMLQANYCIESRG